MPFKWSQFNMWGFRPFSSHSISWAVEKFTDAIHPFGALRVVNSTTVWPTDKVFKVCCNLFNLQSDIALYIYQYIYIYINNVFYSYIYNLTNCNIVNNINPSSLAKLAQISPAGICHRKTRIRFQRIPKSGRLWHSIIHSFQNIFK